MEAEVPGRFADLAQQARVAGLTSFETPTLEAVERRRLQLWVLTLVLLVAVVVALVLLTMWRNVAPAAWLTPRVLQVGLLGLVVLFCTYAIEKELQLRRLTELLVQERVLTAALTNRVKELGALLTAARAINLVLDLQEVLDTILNAAIELLDGSDGSIMLVRGKDELRTVAATTESSARGARLKFGVGIAGRVAASLEPVLVNGVIRDYERDMPYAAEPELPSSAMSVPLTHRGTLLGVLNLNAQPGRSYTEYDLRALTLFGEHAAGAIANAQLHEEQRLLASQRLYQAMHDPLTSLPNRGLFLDRVSHALTRRRDPRRQLALLFIDLDDFKRINDSLGHGAGDEVLVAFAERLRSSLRSGDTVARFGGDEFAVLVEDIAGVDHAVQTAERILASLRQPFPLAGRQLWLRASIGVAAEAAVSQTAEELLRDADTAMNVAKAEGKGRVVVFEPTMHAEALTRLELEAELRLALERDEFTVGYQPIFDLTEQRVMAVEGLVRWQHPTRGLLPASAFLAVAEQAGLLAAIDRHVLSLACGTVRSLVAALAPDEVPVVAVNLCGARLREARLTEEVAAVLHDHGLSGDRLAFEVREADVLRDTDRSAGQLNRLKELGVRITLDGFGTGSSSLVHLHRFPIDTVKVDRLLVEGLTEHEGTRSLVQAILRFGQSLSLDVVAEGIERDDQLDALRRLGCRLGQGYLFARPLPAADLLPFLQSSSAHSPSS